ncbi:MAG: hypothetical protein KGJ01_02165, partial [Patescibacteria group bacterium]|nr:hypothetical protein [Patescibacteria group bacterium]
TAYDNSGWNNNGTLEGATDLPTWTTTGCLSHGSCLSFDGTDDYATVSGVNVNVTANHYNTISFWMNWNGSYIFGSSWAIPIAFSSDYDFAIENNGDFGINTGQGDILGNKTSSYFFANSWVYVVCIMPNAAPTASNSFVYINGQNVPLTPYGSSASKTVSLPLTFAQYSNSMSYGGKLSDIIIYNYAFTAAQAAALYNATKPQ